MVSPDINESIIDDEFLNRKLDLSTRIAGNRGKRIRFRQELSEYQQLEKTGKKPLEDPQIQTEVLRLEVYFNTETELNNNLTKRLNELTSRTQEVQMKFQEVSALIQKQKVQGLEIDVETEKIRLEERKNQLSKDKKVKEAKILNIEHDVKRLRKEIEGRQAQQKLVSLVSSWQQGESPPENSKPYLVMAYQFFSNATESWREARFAYDRNTMPDFFIYCWEALKHSINCYTILISQTVMNDEEIMKDDLQDKVNLLFQNKVVVSTKFIDGLRGLTEKIDHGVAVTPKASYKDEVLDFLTKNMNSLKIG
ncbi:MAG: hypothetical protein ACXAC7_20865 [Candidatus Hodarchaeales archaeon]|jgi:hypothetical protein